MIKTDLIGKKHNKLTVKKFSHINKAGKSLWICVCDCGNETTITRTSIITGNTKSCGCLKKTVGFGSKNGQWKGDKVGKEGVHDWIKRRLKKPNECVMCSKKTTFLDLANISQLYKRDLSDWEYLCRSCHMKKDGRLVALRIIKKTIPIKYCRNCKKEIIKNIRASMSCSMKCRDEYHKKFGHPLSKNHTKSEYK